ncbi:MAG: hypothetical protein LHV68_00630 [Elusimicrobia bacterium]|nr:hypothetical protein [Candidatus Liberimonas magnetica]
MKITEKLNKVVSLATAALMLIPNPFVFAAWDMGQGSAYTYGPGGVQIENIDQANYGKPSEMFTIVPGIPIAAKDKDGNRLYYSPDGALSLRIAKNGEMQFSLQQIAASKIYDEKGKLKTETQFITGTNRQVVRNDKGEITGYNEFGYGGQITKEYAVTIRKQDGTIATAEDVMKGKNNKVKYDISDNNNNESGFKYEYNLSNERQFDQYGKSVHMIVDALTQTKTVFNANNKPQCDINFEGAVVANYKYDSAGNLDHKEDVYGNKTFYDKDGNMTFTESWDGKKTNEYYYVLNEKQIKVLDRSISLVDGISNGDITYFKDGKQTETVSKLGAVVAKYGYDGSTLIYSSELRTNEITWYDITGKSISTTVNNVKVKDWIYDNNGKLSGFYDYRMDKYVFYDFGRQTQEAELLNPSDTPANADYANKMRNAVNKSESTGNSNSLESQGMGLSESKYYYDENGKLQSIVSIDNNDGSGYTTTIFIGDGVSGQDRTSITVTRDQKENAVLADQLWSAVIDNGQSLADVSAGTGELADFAKSIKTMNINAKRIGALTDEQLINLLGWNADAPDTQTYITDVRARAKNAGDSGTVSITFGPNSANDGKVYAAGIQAQDADLFVVGGTRVDKMLDLTSLQAAAGITSAGAVSNVNTPAIDTTLTGDNNQTKEDLFVSYKKQASFSKEVNSVTRWYSANGNVILEIDKSQIAANGVVTKVYDQAGKVTALYKEDILQNAYIYNTDETVQVMKSLDNYKNTITTFYVGEGTAGRDQTEITVAKDQVENTALAQKFWNAIANGNSIADISSGKSQFSSELASLVKTIASIKVSPNLINTGDDQQLCALFGWDVSGTGTAGFLKDIRKKIQEAGIQGSLIINYSVNPGGAMEHTYAASIDIVSGKGLIGTVDLTTVASHDKVVAKEYNNGTFSEALDTQKNIAVNSYNMLQGAIADFLNIMK